MAIETGGVSHIGLRVTDLARAAAFYRDVLGFQEVLAVGGLVLFNAYGLFVGVQGGDPATPPDDRFDPFRVGLDHVALGIADASALAGLALQLSEAGVENHGVERDELTGAQYVSFYDPDGIAWELYAMPSS